MRDEQNDRAENAVWAAWFALWNGDFTQADGIVAKDIRVHTTLLDGSPDTTIQGPSGVIDWIARTRAFLSGLKFTTVVGPLRDGDHMAGHWTATGRYAGGFPGAGAKIGTSITFTGTDVLRLSNDQVTEYWLVTDTATLLSQLGVSDAGQALQNAGESKLAMLDQFAQRPEAPRIRNATHDVAHDRTLRAPSS